MLLARDRPSEAPIRLRLALALGALGASGCLPNLTESARPPLVRKNAMPDLERHVFADPDSGLALPYRLFRPAGCAAERPCGLLLFLHGAGERGTDNESQLANDALAFTAPTVQEGHPAFVVYPQCPRDLRWVESDWKDGSYRVERTPESKPMAAAVKLLAALQAQYPIDPHRLLVTGLSMGGYGTWDILARHPTMFAGALALCGGGDPTQAAAIRDVPVWAFHGDKDPAVPVRGSRRMIEALRKAGGRPRYDEIAGHGHDVWTVAYRNVGPLRWLLDQRRPVHDPSPP
jgi:predicted peptidase